MAPLGHLECRAIAVDTAANANNVRCKMHYRARCRRVHEQARLRTGLMVLTRVLLVLSFMLPLLVQGAWAAAPPDVMYNTFEFPDMRNIDLIGMLVMQPGEQPNQPPGVCRGTLG